MNKEPKIYEELKRLSILVPTPFYWADVNCTVMGINRRGADLTESALYESLIGKSAYDFYTPETAAIVEKHSKMVMNTRKVLSFEEELVALKSGEKRYYIAIRAPLLEDDEVIGVVGSLTDITDKKRVELLEKEKEIAKKNAAIMDVLSSSIAHEIRTPLSIIKINSDIIHMSELIQQLPSSEYKNQFFEHVGNIHQAIKECTQVVDMLLVKLRKIATSEKEDTSLETCSISETINTTLSEYPFRKDEKNKIHVKTIKKDFYYKGHNRLIKHVLFNLLRNSLRVMYESQKGEIFIECKLGKKYNRLIFRDTARGIEEDYLPKIFNKFETTDAAQSGTGLGLAFCKIVMESYEGFIECHAKLGEFAEFTLSFPTIEIN